MEGQLLFKERGISEAWRLGQKTLDMWANCVLKHCLSLKTIIPNCVAFFVLLGIVIHVSFIRKMSFSVTSAKQEFTPAGHCFIIHLPGGGQCPLVRDSEPIRLLEIPMSPNLYMPIDYIVTIHELTGMHICFLTTSGWRFHSVVFLGALQQDVQHTGTYTAGTKLHQPDSYVRWTGLSRKHAAGQRMRCTTLPR